MQNFKNERVTQLLIEEINQMIVLQKIKDPRVSSRVSVLHAKVSKDTTSATIYISSYLEDKTLQKTVDALNHARGYIQSEIHKKHRWRNTPKLHFKTSAALKEGEKIASLLKEHPLSELSEESELSDEDRTSKDDKPVKTVN